MDPGSEAGVTVMGIVTQSRRLGMTVPTHHPISIASEKTQFTKKERPSFLPITMAPENPFTQLL
jgi:hypothetical protein